MEPMRYNLFSLIHKGLRGMLYDTALTLQQTDFTIETEALQAIKKVEQTLEQFENHAYHEDKHVVPVLIGHDSMLAMEIESEHEKDEMLTFRLENKITKFMHAYADDEKRMVGNEIMFGFIDFVAFNLAHMNKEEQRINEVLWKNYSDSELKQINVNIRKTIAPPEMMEAVRLMIKGASNPEITGILNEVKGNAPQEAFMAVEQIAKQELPESRWQKIYLQLVEDVSL